ncbi:uncharacterized protein Pyn_11485 [Prunus yedoensis var. nudiflora]|uniref:Uncharacterized protein n=1 Tax=Prunus yedoensis var. nudiflora TaxID=2094558 RepID=A0A314XI23_PRUYE|nr:uncharacterized protein Pyn_11485 [Prunus yedoensis var. nudiflora]
MAARVLHKLAEPVAHEGSTPPGEVTYGDEAVKSEITNPAPVVDYSNLFEEEFQLPDDHWDSSYLNILDIGAVEEGILHVLYACASQPQLCSKLADRTSDFWYALLLIQALLLIHFVPLLAVRLTLSIIVSLWKQPIVQQALSQIVATSCSSLYRPLHACAGYLSSYSPSHAKAACVLIDLCCGVLAPWLSQVIAKVDLAVEFLEDLLGVIQSACHSLLRARAALKYIVLALSGHMDDMLGKNKEVKHRILFLVEMLEPFLDPAVERLKGIIAFGDLSSAHPEKQEENCVIAVNVIRTAVQKPAVLPSLESEWRRGSVATSVLLSILEPHMQLPPEIDLQTSPVPRPLEPESLSGLSHSSASHHGVASKSNSQDEFDGKIDVSDTAVKIDISEDASLLFAPTELHNIVLTNYFQLITYQDCELRASEFRRLALDLHSQNEITIESHDAAIDALLLAAECDVNPFFMMSFRGNPKLMKEINISGIRTRQNHEIGMRMEKRQNCSSNSARGCGVRREYQEKVSDGGLSPYYTIGFDEQVIRLSPLDVQSADAITLCMIFLLNSATKLYCAPEHLEPETLHGIQRRWILLERLVISSSGGDEETGFAINKNGFPYGSLIPPSVWMQGFPLFLDAYPLLFDFLLGWQYLVMQDNNVISRKYEESGGYVSKNAKAIILYTLEAIVTEHMEAMVPEIPRVVQVSGEERSLVDGSCVNFESLCFDELFTNIRQGANQDNSREKVHNRGLTIFILASVFPDLSAQRRREMLQVLWRVLVQTLQFFGAIPLELPTEGQHESGLESHSWFLSDVYHSSSQDKASEKLEGNNVGADIVNKKVYLLFPEEIEEFSKHLEVLIVKLYLTTELCWNLHHQLSKKRTITSTECFMYSRFLASIAQRVNDAQGNDSEISFPSTSVDQFPDHWRIGIEVISETILTLQENRCWEVASVVLDCVLAVPHEFGLNNVIGSICSAIKSSSCNAPKIAWRLQSDKWLLILLTKGVHSLKECEFHLDWFASVPESIMVSSTWNLVVVLASSDASLLVSTMAMTLLVDCIPFAERRLLQSFLAAADSVLGLGELACPNCEGQLLGFH